MDGVKGQALMVLANGVMAEVITEEQAINVMKAMDDSSKGTHAELDARSKAITPILADLVMKYAVAGGK